MRQFISLLCLASIFACSNPSSIQLDQVYENEERLNEAYLKMDSSLLKELLAPTYALRTPNQTVVTKRRQMRAMGFEILHFKKLQTEIDSVALKDSLAEVFGRVIMNADIVDTNIVGAYQFKRIWAQRGDKLIAISTSMNQQP